MKNTVSSQQSAVGFHQQDDVTSPENLFAESREPRAESQLAVSILKILAVLCLSLIPLSCSKVPEVPDFLKDTFQPEMIVPVFDPDAHIMPQTGTVGYVKNGVKAMAVPLNDVKAVDAFGIFIFNGTDHWISFQTKGLPDA